MNKSWETFDFSLPSQYVSQLFPPIADSLAEEELKTASLIDEINAYSYIYPVGLPSRNFVFKWYVCVWNPFKKKEKEKENHFIHELVLV